VGDGQCELVPGDAASGELKVHEGTPVSIELPQRVTLEVVETEPALKGQTAPGSFKPTLLSNGVRTAVPTHIVIGTRIVISTADGSCVDRASAGSIRGRASRPADRDLPTNRDLDVLRRQARPSARMHGHIR